MKTKPMLGEDCVVTAGELMSRLGINRSTFNTLITAGMPGRLHNGRWYFHLYNVNLWWQSWTAVAVGQGREEDYANQEKGDES